MQIYKATFKLKGEFRCGYYTKSYPNKKKLLMAAWYRYSDGFEKTEEEFEKFKKRIRYRVKQINVGE